MANITMQDTYFRTFTAGATLTKFLRVKIASGVLQVAAATDQSIGYLTERGATSGEPATVRTNGAPEQTGIAAKAIVAGVALYAAASGKVTDTQPADGKRIGIAGGAAAADGSQVLILPCESRDHT